MPIRGGLASYPSTVPARKHPEDSAEACTSLNTTMTDIRTVTKRGVPEGVGAKHKFYKGKRATFQITMGLAYVMSLLKRIQQK